MEGAMDSKSVEIYLLSLKVNGIKNIENEISIDFYNSSFKSFNRDGYKIKAIYGENGVGKSAVMTAVKIFRELLVYKGYLADRNNLEKLSYLLNKKNNKASFESEYYIRKDEISRVYKFGIELEYSDDTFKITHEYCYYRSLSGKYKKLYEVLNDKLYINLSDQFNKYATEISKNLLGENSFLSIVFNNNFDPEFENELIKFEMAITCHIYTYVYLDEKDTHNEFVALKNIGDINEKLKPDFYANRIDYIKCGNKMVVKKEDINSFEKEVASITRFIKIFKPDLIRIEVEKRDNKDSYVCELIFVYDDYSINGEFESTGIRKLVELYTAFKKVDMGYVVFIDELDANIHDYYLCKLLEYVAEYAEGQLCFTTHNLGPMKVLKKYKKSIDFISRGNEMTSWIKNGNYDVSSLYSKGLIDKSPFNLESFDFLEVFGE